MKVDLIVGGPGREAEVSRRSGKHIMTALRQHQHDVAVIDVATTLEPRQLRPGTVVFNIIHGTYGEDGTLQTLLDQLGITYVGSNADVSRLCMDKSRAKERLTQAGVRVPWGVEVHLGRPFKPSDLKLPHHGGLVLKPADDGSSVGLKMVANPGWVLPAIEELLREVGSRRYLIEERLPGPEYTVAVIDEANGPRALPALYIKAAEVFDYAAKYQRDDTIEEPVRDSKLDRRLGEIAVAAYRACGCRDLARIDIMATADAELAVLELNTLPGMTERSLVPKAAAAAGIAFDRLVDSLVHRAAARARITS